MPSLSRAQLGEELLRRLAASLRSAQLYSQGHPLIARNLDSLVDVVAALHTISPAIVVGIVGDELIVGDTPVSQAGTLAPLIRRLRQLGIERITIERGVERRELDLLTTFVSSARMDGDQVPPFPAMSNIRVGRVTAEERTAEKPSDMTAFRQMYDRAVQSAEQVWESARTEQRPDPAEARGTVDALAEAVAENRPALLALTALREYDNYTFTHMVNVSILTMAQARALGVEGPLLREFGLAGLMHDIGKVKTPLEILNKAETLTPGEFDILKRHPVDGAEILRATPDIPALAPVVAFEHHLRLDGSGYPSPVSRRDLNLATRLCSIADVYDAMRSQRVYQGSFPTDRIMAVLRRKDGQHFDEHLVRRFAQLLGVYPVGTVVRLNTSEIAMVVDIHAPDPFRPQVRLLFDRHGARLAHPLILNLWESAGGDGVAATVTEVVDPMSIGIDPLALL
jgi:putative nucleotidyltransferase with HDIG domain